VERGIRNATILALTGAVLYLLFFVYGFAQERFFTKDEFQWGHLAWLVQQGEVPYLDFYEHHLPLGYLVHAWLVPESGTFAERALFLRKLEFVYFVLAVGSLSAATYVVRRSTAAALMTAALSLGFGFSLMSAIEFRADNWSGFAFLICLSLLEINRGLRSRALAIGAGAIFALAVFTTQKILLLGGLGLAAMVAVSLLRGPRAREVGDSSDSSDSGDAAPLVVHAGIFCASGLAITTLLISLAAWAGLLERAFEINVSQAIAHERLYPDDIGVWIYAEPFLAETLLSTLVVLLAAGLYLRRGLAGFWVLPLLLGAVGSFAVRAQFPYNFVTLCLLIAVCASRGFADAIDWLSRRSNDHWKAAAPLLYLVPVLLLVDQLGFVHGRTGNEHQLRLLEMIERQTDAEDVILDDSGSALFRPDRGYYWYHDMAHVQMFADYFENEFIEDMRGTEAIFWIRGTRLEQLPADAQRYLTSHYVRHFGSLHVLGFDLEAASSRNGGEFEVDIIRTGDYFVTPRASGLRGASMQRRLAGLTVDGEEMTGSSVHLGAGTHVLGVAPGTPALRFTLLPPVEFGEQRGMNHFHDPGFEFRRR
jgi:hypothetical protein